MLRIKTSRLGFVQNEMKKTTLTKQEYNGVYELLCEYLFNEKNPPLVGFAGISPDGFVGLVHLFERINGTKPKSDYKMMLFKLVDENRLMGKLKE